MCCGVRALIATYNKKAQSLSGSEGRARTERIDNLILHGRA